MMMMTAATLCALLFLNVRAKGGAASQCRVCAPMNPRICGLNFYSIKDFFVLFVYLKLSFNIQKKGAILDYQERAGHGNYLRHLNTVEGLYAN